MKQWGLATVRYRGDNDDKLPLLGDVYPYATATLFWYQKLAPYVVKASAAEPGNMEAYTAEVRKSPAGKLGPPPLPGAAVAGWNTWNCWVGVYYCPFGSPLSPPASASRTKPIGVESGSTRGAPAGCWNVSRP